MGGMKDIRTAGNYYDRSGSLYPIAQATNYLPFNRATSHSAYVDEALIFQRYEQRRK
jgi:hypothetical protein